MAFIEKAGPKAKRKGTSLQLDLDVRTELGEYVRFIGKPQGQVVSEILREVFRRDKEFLEWKQSKPVEVQPRAAQAGR